MTEPYCGLRPVRSVVPVAMGFYPVLQTIEEHFLTRQQRTIQSTATRGFVKRLLQRLQPTPTTRCSFRMAVA
jgi:hypothetical protein